MIALTVGSIVFMLYFRLPDKRPIRRLQPCPESTDVYAVGSCEKFMTHVHNCKSGMIEDWHRDMEKALNREAVILGKSGLRELRLENGKAVTPDAPVPEKVFALFDRDLFVFPTCDVGTEYPVHLPSINANVNVTVVSTSPRVLVVENLFTPAEAEEIITTAKGKMQPSTVSMEGSEAKSFTQSSRTSSTAWLNPGHYAVSAALRQRVSELIGIDFDNADTPHIVVEEMQVLRYEHKQHYHIHHDYFDPVLHSGFLQQDGRNRFITVLFYLSDVEEGGETAFPMAGDPRPVTDYTDCSRGIRVAPKLGRVAIFYSLHPERQQYSSSSKLTQNKDGSLSTEALDVSSWHSGCDVFNGTKWAANYWITLKGVHAPY